ncbi:MAG TPA: phosphatase PAP2 family protein, partial [Chthonomonadales bacterium]|nr:phosphatase PAP2 family protein [Chthonomonadales bacterium]
MCSPIRHTLVAACLLCALYAAGSAQADSAGRQVGKFLSGPGAITYGVVALSLPLLTDHDQGKVHTLRVIDSLAVTYGLTEGLKALVREKRPDSNGHDSFPSGHASLGFSIAAMESAFHPANAPYWFAGATL